ncbi:MAG: hypothetical protein ACI8RP_001866 [Urechidicola sp.]|jgi:hypothetical protein
MRKITLLILASLLIGCQNQAHKLNGFIIKGNVKNLNNSELLVLKFMNGGIEGDSISVVNNKFEYTGKVKEPYFVQLLIKNGKTTKGKLTEFMIENSEIIIEGNSTEYDSVKVSGSKSDKILKEYLKKDQTLDTKWNELKLEYDTYVESNDTINLKKVGKELNYILQVERIGLLKKYVSDNSSSTVGALLPNFCTIENVLTKENYKELYDSLSEEIKTSGYGQGLLEKSKETKE